MSEESKAEEKSATQKSWFSGPMINKLGPFVDPARFSWWPDRATMQRIEEAQRASESWQKLMTPALAALNEINQQASETFAAMHRMMEQQAKLFQLEVNSAFFEQARLVNQKFSELTTIDWEAIGRDHAEGAKELADRGWFITMDSPFYFHRHFSALIREGRLRGSCKHPVALSLYELIHWHFARHFLGFLA